MLQNLKTHSGNLVAVEFDNVRLGLIQSLSAQDDYGLQPASGVGDIHVTEYVPGQARHSLNISEMKLLVGNMRQVGLIPQNGDDALKGLVFDINVYSKLTKEFLYGYIKCSYASGSTDVSAHRIVVGSGVFLALDRRGTMI